MFVGNEKAERRIGKLDEHLAIFELSDILLIYIYTNIYIFFEKNFYLSILQGCSEKAIINSSCDYKHTHTYIHTHHCEVMKKKKKLKDYYIDKYNKRKKKKVY